MRWREASGSFFWHQCPGVSRGSGIQGFKILSSQHWGTCELSNMWKKNRTNCSLGPLWVGQEVFCLKLIKGSLVFYKIKINIAIIKNNKNNKQNNLKIIKINIVSHDLVGKNMWNRLRRRLWGTQCWWLCEQDGSCFMGRQGGKGMSWYMWQQPDQALQCPCLMMEHWEARAWQRMERAAPSPGKF